MLFTEYMAGLNYEKVALDDPGVSYGGDNVVKKDAFYFKAGDLPTELAHPGDVYLRMLYYIPHEGDSITDFAIYASATDSMLTVTDMNGSEDAPALTVKNIGFEGSDWKSENRYVTQAADDIPAAVTILNSSYLVFENCAFDHIGNYAAEIQTSVHHVTFDHC